jgi:dTDP-4-dehydrorhamnose 3,5-epimerase
MLTKNLAIKDLILITPDIHEDKRGFFIESYNQKDFNCIVGKDIEFVQDNHSRSIRGTLRGLHIQTNPYSQAKLVRVLQGVIFDVAVDLRQNSSTFLQWVGVELSSENKQQLWIPEGFAHGFLVLSDFAEVLYKVNEFYNPNHEISYRWNDPKVNIIWPKIACDFLISEKDANAPYI